MALDVIYLVSWCFALISCPASLLCFLFAPLRDELDILALSLHCTYVTATKLTVQHSEHDVMFFKGNVYSMAGRLVSVGPLCVQIMLKLRMDMYNITRKA